MNDNSLEICKKKTGNGKVVVGVILDQRGDPPFVSVKRLWNRVVNLLSSYFTVHIYQVSQFNVDCDNNAFRNFIDEIQVLVSLSPYYSLDRTIANVPLVIFSLGSLHKGGHWLSRNQDSVREGDLLVLNSQACQRIFDDTVASHPLLTSFIPLGINTRIFSPRINKKDIRHQYEIPENAFVLAYSGRISIQKNAHLLLSVVRKLRSYDNVHLILTGFFDDFYIPEFSERYPPESRIEFEQLIKLFGVEDMVTVIPHQDDPNSLADILACADTGITLATQIGENFGYTPVEMQACGLPVICAEWAGFRDTVLDGITGFHVDTTLTRYGVRVSYEQAATHIKCLVQNRERLATMAGAAVKHAEKYDLSEFGNKLCQAVETVAGNRAENNRLPPASFILSPALKHLHTLLEDDYGDSRHISWEHLHPNKDFKSYQQILSHCVSYDASRIVWTPDCRIAKAIDWIMETPHKVIFRDPRWNPSFELNGIKFEPDELKTLWQIDQGTRQVDDLMACLKKEEFWTLLENLAEKGMILPKKAKLEKQI
ncbi:MAG: glycosyltransferase family 4 protein [bacterium]|nr:glycosyltransferase family 4 protein [bacterium]